MVYVKHVWINDSPPALEASNLNEMEEGIYDATRKDTFDVQSILAAVVNNVPLALAVAEQTLLGRITGGNIAALTSTQIRTLLSIVALPSTVAAVLSDHNKAAHDILAIDAGSVGNKEPGTTAGKIPYLDGSAYLTLSQIVGNIPALDAVGKLILTGSSQIGTKATDLATLWDKTTKIVKADIDSGEFNVASKIPALDASVYLALSQIVGNVPALDAVGKLILTGSSQIGTKTADLVNLWTKGTLIDDSMIGLNEIHAEGSSSFAGSGGVTITHNLDLANYSPSITPTADGAGATGEFWITDIAVNSFVVRNSGSGVTAFTWIVHNRT